MRNQYLTSTLSSIRETLPSFKFVKIDEAGLNASANVNFSKNFVERGKEPMNVYPKNPRALPSFLFFANVINFCFAHKKLGADGRLVKFEAEVKRGEPPLRGSYAMLNRFYRLFGEKPITSGVLLEKIATLSRFKNNFRGSNSMPILRERWRLLVAAAISLEVYFKGDVMNFLEAGGWSVSGGWQSSGLLKLFVRHFPGAFGSDLFCDKRNYFSPSGKTFYFFKRAHLFLANYQNAALRSGGVLPQIRDAENIGPMIDYVLPRGYFLDGILKYSPDLEKRVRNCTPIERHSQEEVEIRAATFLAHWKELVLINRLRDKSGLAPINITELDSYRWSRGLEDSKKMPHHLCFSTDY